MTEKHWDGRTSKDKDAILKFMIKNWFKVYLWKYIQMDKKS